jgi:hypothetical protein
MAAAREQWQAWQKTFYLSRLLFLDERSASADSIRRYGRARYVDTAPAGHWQPLTFVAGLWVDQLNVPWC